MNYSNKQIENSARLLKSIKINHIVVISLSVILFSVNLYLICNAFLKNEEIISCSFIALLITFILSVFLLGFSFSYVKGDDYTLSLLKKISTGGSVRELNIDVCPCCDNHTQKHVETYTTGEDNTWMGDVANFGGKYGTKKIAGSIGETIGTVLGCFIGMPELGAIVGKETAKAFAGEIYDDTVKSAVSSNFKDTRQVHTRTYYTCPSGCVLPNDMASLDFVFSINYTKQDSLFRFCRQTLLVLSVPYLALLTLLVVVIIIGLPSFLICLCFADISITWVGHWHWYVGGVWSWFVEFFSKTWYVIIPAIIILFSISHLSDNTRELRKESKYLEFGINNDNSHSAKQSVLIVLLTLISFVCPVFHLLPANSDINDNGYEYVDLGLSVCWATKNIGAMAIEDKGDFLSWGEVSPKYSYTDRDYMYRGNTAHMIDAEKEIINPRHDAARRLWGGDWRMPTIDEFNELISKCSWTIRGMGDNKLFVGKSTINGNVIVLPATGLIYTETHIFSDDENIYEQKENGCYWTSNTDIHLLSADGVYACINGTDNMRRIWNSADGYKGLAVRPVLDVKGRDSKKSSSKIDQLSQLKELLDKGLISKKDYETRKSKILGN